MTEENNANVVVEAAGLTKVFNDFWGRAKAHAVNGIDFKVRQGQVFGFLGPNGSGKSTTIIHSLPVSAEPMRITSVVTEWPYLPTALAASSPPSALTSPLLLSQRLLGAFIISTIQNHCAYRLRYIMVLVTTVLAVVITFSASVLRVMAFLLLVRQNTAIETVIII